MLKWNGDKPDWSILMSCRSCIDDCQIATAAEYVTDKDAASRLWARGESLVGEKFKFKFNHTL